MVSPIDHVVMNHQNQTQTNGIWGHVRYREGHDRRFGSFARSQPSLSCAYNCRLCLQLRGITADGLNYLQSQNSRCRHKLFGLKGLLVLHGGVWIQGFNFNSYQIGCLNTNFEYINYKTNYWILIVSRLIINLITYIETNLQDLSIRHSCLDYCATVNM
jgi:hypothetical protein